MLSEAERWERGSREDPIRNQFVVPTLGRLIGKHRPDTILDIGAGTGYVAREIDALLNFDPYWTLIDLNEQRLRLAQDNCPKEMALECLTGNVFDWPWEVEHYPFRASRIEDLLGRILKAGFDLIELEHGRVGSQSAFVLAFKRRAPER